MPEPPHRLFIAVPVPEAALEACRAVIDVVRRDPAGRRVRWVRTENLHVTLRFLGETPPDRPPAVEAAMTVAAAGRAPFEVTLARAGAYPVGRRPRALWLGIADGADELAGLVARLERPLAIAGWPPEARPFRPHLTVARTDAAPIAEGVAAAEALIAAAADWRVSFRVDRVVLYRSHLGGGPPRYEPVAEVALSG